MTRAEISLDAIEANVRALRRRAEGRALMAVVKANAYGHGAEAVARAALDAGASWLAVYTVDEGVSLRGGGIRAPILVFGPFEDGEADDIVRHGLTPTIHSAAAAESLGRVADGARVPYHLKVDTGLTRAGVRPEDVLPLVQKLRAMPWLEPEGIYTHLASAEEPDPTTTTRQLERFRSILEALRQANQPFRVAHTCNSAGTLTVADDLGDIVRAGIALYGYYPAPHLTHRASLRPALALLSAITRLTTIEPGTGVGYGHEFRADRKTRIALVPIGYGDGLHRSAGHGSASVLVRGMRAPIVGRVSMDQVTADVTDIPGVTQGDEVTLIGRQGTETQTADELAAATGTISYEILSSLQGRVPRIYSRAGRIVATSRHGVLTYWEKA